MINLLVEGWRLIPHSYAQVLCFQLIHFYKMYGPNGTNGHLLTIYFKESLYYNIDWYNKLNLLYSNEYNKILINFKEYNNEKVDIIYRITFPYNITVFENDKNIPKCIFYTSEFKDIDYRYFRASFPENIIEESEKEEYISIFINYFRNIYFTSPSVWSSNGIIPYFKSDESLYNRNKIITHGVDTTIFNRLHNNTMIRNKIRQEYGVLDTDILLINIGAMTHNKGIYLIIELLHHLINKFGKTNYKLILKGNGDMYSSKLNIESTIGRLQQQGRISIDESINLLKYIIFVDKMLTYEDINNLYNASDLYVSPYLAEGFGLTILESLASGLNVLVPKTGSTKEYIDAILQNGGSDFIFYVESKIVEEEQGKAKYMNKIEIEDLVNVVINNEHKFKNVKDNAQMFHFIQNNYSWYNVCQQLYDYFNEIVNNKIIIQ
jgi:glycosyltransferase involved in cell wall biosynthesis